LGVAQKSYFLENKSGRAKKKKDYQKDHQNSAKPLHLSKKFSGAGWGAATWLPPSLDPPLAWTQR